MANPYSIKVRAWGSSATYTDLTPYLAYGGLKWSRNDIDASDAGRDTQDGLMHRARVAIKVRLDCTCKPLEQTDVTTVLQGSNQSGFKYNTLTHRKEACRPRRCTQTTFLYLS